MADNPFLNTISKYFENFKGCFFVIGGNAVQENLSKAGVPFRKRAGILGYSIAEMKASRKN